MGFWHTGYIEHHEVTGLGEVYRPSKPVYRCHHCDEQFDDMDALRQHRFEAHPYVRPVLFIRGVELGSTTFRVTQRAAPGDFVIERAAAAKLNGQSVSLADLPKALSKVTFDKVRVELSNKGTSAAFELAFRIASYEDLAGVETAFLTLAKKGTLNITSIEGFIEDCRAYPTADGYCDGICHYLYGVLAKERAPDSSVPYEEYRTRFNRAADELLDYDRSIARMVRALVSFHFNHFADAAAAAPTGRLRSAADKFAALLNGRPWFDSPASSSARRSAQEDLLTDHETLRILRWTGEPMAQLVEEIQDIEALAKRDIPEFDRVKLRMLHAEASAAAGDKVAARKAARELIGSPKTVVWAERLLASFAGQEGTS